MSRPIGSKNKVPSKRDLTKVSLSTIYLTMGFIRKLIKSNELSTVQQLEVQSIMEKMTHILESGKKHIKDKDYRL